MMNEFKRTILFNVSDKITVTLRCPGVEDNVWGFCDCEVLLRTHDYDRIFGFKQRSEDGLGIFRIEDVMPFSGIYGSCHVVHTQISLYEFSVALVMHDNWSINPKFWAGVEEWLQASGVEPSEKWLKKHQPETLTGESVFDDC